MSTTQLHLGDCLDVLQSMDSASVSAIVTDPPYGIAFMQSKWDYAVPSVAIWEQCLRVLKPGGHLLAFAGTRTQHRMCVNIEDAGFEIRDMIAWVYGSGFPKSMNIGKKLEGWDGWGTALKPALEPITVARKPFKGTVANNVLEHGTGAINIDGCRIEGVVPKTIQGQSVRAGEVYGADQRDQRLFEPHAAGRWPANLIHDGSDEVTQLFPDTKSGNVKAYQRANRSGWAGPTPEQSTFEREGDSGSAARFFYTAKASKDDRDKGNTHPTVKPTDLMAYLCRLVTPPGGIVLDPFMGSGTTGKAALSEGFSFIGIERDPDYYAICESRFNGAQIGLPLAV